MKHYRRSDWVVALQVKTTVLKSSLIEQTFLSVSEIDIYFQLDFPSTATTTDYARVTLGPDMTATTVCFWMNSDDTQNQGTPFSYATEEGDNILTLTDYDGFVELFAIVI